MNAIAPYHFPEQVAYKTLNLLFERKAMLKPNGIAFYVWQRSGRLVIVFDPNAIDTERVSDDFAHRLSSRLNGRRVVRTNSRGLFLQVGYDIPSAPLALTAQTLNFSDQPSAWHLPVGTTANGPLWISLLEGDSFLIGGTRGNGKSGLANAWIQALLHGDKTSVYAIDGKRGAEFGRYIGHPKFHFMLDATQGLNELHEKLTRRLDYLTQKGHPNIITYNQAKNDFIEPIALVVDEIADLSDEQKTTLKRLVELFRAAGLYPVLATNRPTQAAILVKGNLATRVCFRVPSFNDSIMVLGNKGAETLPDERGRGLIDWKGHLTEFQAFTVTYPQPSADALRQLYEQAGAQKEAEPDPAVNEIAQLAASIKDQWKPDMSGSKVAALLGKAYAGSWYAKINKVVEYLKASTTTSTVFMAQNAVNGTVEG